MRDAYLLAAAIGFAHQTATPVSEMDMGKKPRSIREDHIIGTKDGTGKEKTGTGKRLALLAGLLSHILTPETFDDGDDEEQRLDKQISELASDGDDQWRARLAILDQYAYYGFEWMMQRLEEQMTMDELVFKVIEDVQAQPFKKEDFNHIGSIFARHLD